MKKFNQEISVTVSVDSIAEKLLSTFSGDFKHAEMLTETLIGTSMDKGTLGFLYNSLNGFTNDIDFKKGDIITCSESTYGYIQNEADAEGVITYTEKRIPIGDCTVIEINLYRNNKLCVEFSKRNSKGEYVPVQQWVDHKECS